MVYYLLLIKDLFILLPQNRDNPQFFAQSYMAHIFSGPLITLGLLAFVTHIGLMVYYIIHVTTYKVKSEGEKIMWILLFVFIGSISFIIYFFMRVVPLQPQAVNENNAL